MIDVIVNEELRRLITPLNDDEFKRLEKKILKEGMREPIIVWAGHGVVIDGHNRLRICREHNISFDVEEMEFDTIDDVKVWMLENQLARRNLTDLQRIDAVHKLEDIEDNIRKAAEKTSLANLKKGSESPNVEETPEVEKFPPRGKTRDILGKYAGNISGKTYEHGVYAIEHAPEAVVEAAMNGDLSVNAAYEVARMEPGRQQEVANSIDSGKEPKRVMRDMRKQLREQREAEKREAERRKAEEVPAQEQFDDNEPETFMEDDEPDDEVTADVEQGQAILKIGNGIGKTESCDLLITEVPSGLGPDEWLYAALSSVRRTGHAYVFIDPTPENLNAYLNASMPIDVTLEQVLVWAYDYIVGNSDYSRYKPSWKAILYFRSADATDLRFPYLRERNAVHVVNAEGGELGKQEFELRLPLELAERLINQSTKEGDLVFDPFAQYGAFLIGAMKNGRDAIGYEEDESKANVAFSRGVSRG